MCRGIEEARKQQFDLNKPLIFEEGSAGDAVADVVSCELCGSRASLYCQADDAFLCGKCDKWVHGANFLAHRHIRCVLCDTCQSLTHRYLIGTSREVVLPSIVSSTERITSHDHEQCNSTVAPKSSRHLKRPFLFL